MIDFYSDGSTVGVALSGWTMVILIFFAILISFNWNITKVTLIKKFIIWYKVNREVKKTIPYWWKIDYKLSDFFLISKSKVSGDYYIPITIRYKVIEKLKYTKYSIKTNLYMSKEDGTIIPNHLLSAISKVDNSNGIDCKQMYRDKKLKDLGV